MIVHLTLDLLLLSGSNVSMETSFFTSSSLKCVHYYYYHYYYHYYDYYNDYYDDYDDYD